MAETKQNKWLPFVMAAFGGVPGWKAGQGIVSKQNAGALGDMSTEDYKKKKGFEDYTTPEAYGEQKDYMKTLLGLSGREQMPGYDEQKQAINEGVSSTMSGAQNLDAGSAAAVLLGANEGRRKSIRDLGIMSMQYQSNQQNQARQNYGQVLGQGAQYEDKAFDYNTWLPQQMKWNEQMGYQNKGDQQIDDAIDMGTSFMLQGANMGANQQYYNSMMPQQGSPQGAGQGSMNPSWQGPQYNYGQNQWGPSNNNQYPYNFATGQQTPPQY